MEQAIIEETGKFYNFLSAGNRTYKDKSFYYCIAPDISSCPFGMDVSFYRFKCGVVVPITECIASMTGILIIWLSRNRISFVGKKYSNQT